MKKIKLFLFAAMLLGSVGLHASNTITYTATEQLLGYSGSLDEGKTTFGPAIIGHEFSGNTGVITCAGEITTIGEYAFRSCSALTSITIPNSVTTIGKYAFEHCNGLTSIEIPHSVTSIGRGVFYNCYKLTSVEIPNSVTIIEDYFFYGCSGLTSVELPYSVTTIGEKAFAQCQALTSITIPTSVTTIGTSAFYNCSRLNSITIPNSVTTIGDYAFDHCYGLTSVAVSWTNEKSMPSMGAYVFSMIADEVGPAGAMLLVPEGTKRLYQHADVWKEFGYIIEVGNITSFTYTATEKLPGYNGSLQLGATTFGPAIIGHEFSGNTGVITCANEITTIGNYAFYDCSGLTSVTIPNSVTTIGDDAFRGCYRLTSVTIPNSVTTIGEWAFYNCTGLTSVTIGNSVTTIGEAAFYLCTGLTSVTIPNSVTTIGEWAFHDCEGLTSVEIPNSVTTIGKSAFEYCTGLTVVTINSNAICSKTYPSSSTIGNIFGYQVKEYIIGNSVTTIGDYAFYNCTGLTLITIPNSVTTIGDYAFYNCTGLTSITIPNSVTTIGEHAFAECIGLTSITIPNSVTTIGNYAFDGCSSLTSVTIPNSVTTIGDEAFYYCTGLTSVVVFWTDEKSIPSINSNVFGGIAHGSGPTRAKLCVPKGTEELYQQADVWKEFGGIESDIVIIDNLWYRILNVRTVNLIANQDTTTTGERIPYSGDAVIPKTIIYNGNNSIAAIEDSAFYNAKLTSLTVLTDFPLPCSEHTFTGQDKSIPLYVLDVPAFQSAKYWKEFTNILFYQPYKEEAKKKVQDIVNGIPSQYASLAKLIADNYFQNIENVNTIRQVDDLTARTLKKLQVFYDQGLWIKSGDYWLLKGKELLK